MTPTPPSSTTGGWNSSGDNQTTPSGGKIALGWVVGEKPASSYFNWFMAVVDTWVTWLSALASSDVTWNFTHTFPSATANAVANGSVGFEGNAIGTGAVGVEGYNQSGGSTGIGVVGIGLTGTGVAGTATTGTAVSGAASGNGDGVRGTTSAAAANLGKAGVHGVTLGPAAAVFADAQGGSGSALLCEDGTANTTNAPVVNVISNGNGVGLSVAAAFASPGAGNPGCAGQFAAGTYGGSIRLVPQSSAPSAPLVGEMYVNSTGPTLYICLSAGSWTAITVP